MNNRELALEIISNLDEIARTYDSYEYGLPVFDEHMEEMIEAVVKLLEDKTNEK